ncbi:enoyl-CoA hydratase [Chloroflexus aggregans]|uniref:Enoyl-CoA hydratase domain-containing protein 3, mitochondrial n=1 Tax=Chloroflexus aggregans (strain MD-66 / DSM 9485) TaxID=326427 RepID=B8GBV0_CHLAD|nr:enoyl-CoA hydratase [Chloroflexus aggregans]ACL24917.1 Enoyl-CoA hydratase/isomerase [Chloroflexus aggregans DSM 9485]
MQAGETAVEPYVLCETDSRGVARITLNRPRQFNALSEEMLAALQAQLDAIATNPHVRVVVLAGAGKAFCAGHDLKQMLAHPDQHYYEDLFARCSQMMLTIQRMPQPVIARVHGIATAAGCQLVAMCDLAVASSEAKFAVSGINVGLFCSTPSVALSRNIGRKAAFEMLVTGEFIDAETAHHLGLVNRVAPPDQLDATIEQLVDAILSKPAESIAIGKSLFYRQIELPMAEAYQLAGQTMACNMMEPCAQEGVTAFVEKRPPVWANSENR